MFGRKIPQIDPQASDDATERTTSYRQGTETAPATTGVRKTTSYVNGMQRDYREYQTIN